MLKLAKNSERKFSISVELGAFPRQPDCFKCRNNIGLDVAQEALREARQEKRMTRDEMRFAKIYRLACLRGFDDHGYEKVIFAVSGGAVSDDLR